MNDLPIQKLTPYVKQIVDLETSVHYQKQAIEYVRKEKEKIKEPEKRTAYVQKPLKRTYSEPSKPYLTDYDKKKKSDLIKIIISFILAVAIIPLLFFYCFYSKDSTRESFGSRVGIFIILMVIFDGGAWLCFFIYKSYRKSSIVKTKKYQTDLEKYQKDLEDYQEKTRQAEEDYEKAMSFYRKRIANEEQRLNEIYNDEKRIVSEKKASFSKLLQSMNVCLSDTEKTLDLYYGHDIIYPKYRNLIAMCTIFEYLETGRCTELAGPNGAYNLYEAELRQNIIIGKLDIAVNKLEQIKDNQYKLFCELQKTNDILNNIATTITQIAMSTSAIEQNSDITAYYSQITAENTGALASMTMYNSSSSK